MDFNLSDDQEMIQDMARKFAADALAPHAEKWDEEKIFPNEVIRSTAALGFGGIYTTEEHGGVGMSRLDAVLIFEALSGGCTATSAFISIHNMATWMIDTFGSDVLREKYVPDLTAMKKVASYCLTEPGSGSDSAALKTKAVKDGNSHYVINGTKSFISGAGHNEVYVVMARTGADGPKGISAFVVEKGTEGLSFGANERKMGWNAQPTATVNFDNVRIPAENLIGAEGDGFKFAMIGLDGGRLNIAACSLGTAQEALKRTIDYTKDRNAFGKSLQGQQVVQFHLADMATKLEVSRTILYRAAAALDANDPRKTELCAMAKRFVTDECFDVINQALQLHGGYGYLRDHPIERMLRDVRVHQILEGANDIMKLIIARSILK